MQQLQIAKTGENTSQRKNTDVTTQSASTQTDPHLCDQCDFSTLVLADLERHKKIHSGDRLYWCQECDYRTNSFGDLENHASYHMKARVYRCQKCDFQTKSLGELNKHVDHHYEVKKSMTDPRTKPHRNSIREKPVRWNCYCPKCKIYFRDEYERRQHVDQYPVVDKREACEECHLNFNRDSDLRQHKAIRHHHISQIIRAQEIYH